MKTAILSVILTFIVGTAYAGNNYQYSYNNNHEVVEIIEKRIQIDPRYFLGQEGLYAVGEGIAHEKQALEAGELEILKAENAKLQAQLDLIIKLLTKGGVAPTPVPSDAEPTVPVEPEPEPEVPTLEQDVFNLLKAKCYTCHKNDANGITIFEKGGAKLSDELTLNDVVNIHHRTEGIVLEDGETLMPKGGQPLSAKDMKLLKKWMYERSL